MNLRHLFVTLLLAVPVLGQDPAASTPSPMPWDKLPDPPPTKKVTGKLTFHRPDMKSVEAWQGVSAEVEGVPLRTTRLVTPEILEKLDGRRVEVLYHSVLDGTAGRWEFFPPGESGPVMQAPADSQEGAVVPVVDGGVTVASARWTAARTGGYPILSIRELGP